jgi:Uma2 family endonuclease
MRTATKHSRRLWTVDDYYRMGELGILPESGIELMDGVVREKNAWGTPRRWTYEDVLRMTAGGILDEDERLELIDGDLVCMTPIGHRHVYTVDLLTEFLGAEVRGRAILRVQSPLRFHSGEAPEPDLVVLRLHPDRYRSREAGPWDALLVVEVADSSLDRDLEKAALYARAAIGEYWIGDVNAPSVIVHHTPVGGEYAVVREYRYGEVFASPVLGREIRVDEVLGPA